MPKRFCNTCNKHIGFWTGDGGWKTHVNNVLIREECDECYCQREGIEFKPFQWWGEFKSHKILNTIIVVLLIVNVFAWGVPGMLILMGN